MSSKRVQRRPDPEILPPRRRSPPRDYKHYSDVGSPGGDCAIAKHFAPGTAGRPKGAGNLVNRLLKICILEAAEMSRHNKTGDLRGYCKFIADEYPQVFARSLLGRLLPLQLRADVNIGRKPETVAEVREKLRAAGIPIDRVSSLFERPRLPDPLALQRRRDHPPPAPPDEDDLGHEPGPVDRTNDVTEPPPNLEPRPEDNPYSRHFKPKPHTVGPVPLDTQYEFAFTGVSNPDLHAWHWGRPPRLVSDRSNEETTDETPTQAAE
jgi:hypothetical protein